MVSDVVPAPAGDDTARFFTDSDLSPTRTDLDDDGATIDLEKTNAEPRASEPARAPQERESDPVLTVVASADDTLEQKDAPNHVEPARPRFKRRASGPRKRVTLTTDAVRDAIEARYREEGQWEALVELHLNRLDATKHTAEKVEILKAVAQILAKHMNDPGQAFDALMEALVLAPKDDETATALEDVARTLSKWPMLIQEVKGRLDKEKDDGLVLRYAELLTRWHRVELDDPAAAEPYLARIKELDPSHPLVHHRLARAYAEAGAWDAQKDALSRALLSSKRTSDKIGFHLALADVYETRANDLDHAIEHYEAALTLEPRCMEALLGLERVARVREDFVELLRALERQVDRAPSNEPRVRALLRLAELHEKYFLKPQQAARRFESAFELAGSDEGARFLALDGLERAYHAMRAWRELADTLERRAKHTTNALERCDVLMRAGEVYESKRGDIDGAMAIYRRVYEEDSGHKQALGELARLSEKTKDWTSAAAYRSRVADLVDDARARAHIHYQIGELLIPEGRDVASARLHYEKAVELDPRHANAWEALRTLATRAGDGMHAVYCLERRAEHTDSARAKAHLLVELARMKTALGDVRGAFATYDWALRTDPSNEIAARAVFDDYVREGRWADAQPACDLLIGVATRQSDEGTLFALLRVATRIALALGAPERALLAALAAYDMRPNDADARAAALSVCHRLKDDESVRARTRDVVARIRAQSSELGPGSLVDLAEMSRAGGDDAEAIEMLCRALALDAESPRALRALGEAFAARGEWARACTCRERLAHAEADPEKQRAQILEVAELWETRAKNPAKAVLLLEEELTARPDDLVVLHRVVALYGGMGLWDKLLVALRAVADVEEDPSRKAKSIFAMAGVTKDKLGDARRAAALYEEVLAIDDGRLDAFEKIVRVFTELRDWSELRRAYERMLARVRSGADAGDVELEHALQFQLGLIFRDRLGDMARALDAFRAASAQKPDSDDDRKAVVELLVAMEQPDLAAATLRAASARRPLHPLPYRELAALHVKTGAYDKAWCAIDALVHLDEATDEERAFRDAYPPRLLADVPGTLAPGAWVSHILHPDLDLRLSAVLRAITPAMLRMRFASIGEAQRKAFLGPRIDVDEGQDARAASSEGIAARIIALITDVCEVLGMPVPALHERPTMPMPFAVAPAPTPALFVSLQAFEATPEDLRPFLAARRVGELRADLTAHALFPTVGELKGLLKAAVRVAVATGTKDGLSSLKPDERALAKEMTAKDLDDLRAAASSVVGGAERVEIKRWLELADASLSRAALLVTGDFDTAYRAVQTEARAPRDLPLAEWRSEMLAFMLSDEHADLRGAIGVDIGASE